MGLMKAPISEQSISHGLSSQTNCVKSAVISLRWPATNWCLKTYFAGIGGNYLPDNRIIFSTFALGTSDAELSISAMWNHYLTYACLVIGDIMTIISIIIYNSYE